jgi:hypothetical protein
MMRPLALGLALLGATPLLAQAQISPATPDRNPPAAATEGSTRPGMAQPTPTMPRVDSVQQQTPGGAAPTTGATTPNQAVQGGPQAGANSFTEAQARSRMEAAGFTGVAGLMRDEQGIWRARAMRGGQQVGVALDYQGQVSVR